MKTLFNKRGLRVVDHYVAPKRRGQAARGEDIVEFTINGETARLTGAQLLELRGALNTRPTSPREIAKKPRQPMVDYGPSVLFSVHKAAEGGQSFRDAKEQLVAAGVRGIKRGYSPYVGQYGISIPKRFEAKANKVLFR